MSQSTAYINYMKRSSLKESNEKTSNNNPLHHKDINIEDDK